MMQTAAIQFFLMISGIFLVTLYFATIKTLHFRIEYSRNMIRCTEYIYIFKYTLRSFDVLSAPYLLDGNFISSAFPRCALKNCGVCQTGKIIPDWRYGTKDDPLFFVWVTLKEVLPCETMVERTPSLKVRCSNK